jgi:hypothetical protein
MNRKTFFFNTGMAAAGLLAAPMNSLANYGAPDPYSATIVKEFVGAGHNNLAKVKELLSEYPNLLYCRYDWGNGDFEEAIEGAGHVGNKEIANFLISQGARPNIYVLTMLGETAIVKSILERYPSLLFAKGAHGYTLLHHAVRGGDTSAELCDYFERKGLKDLRIMLK